ncbi:MAG TPA: pyruvate ferredoxin oxidoreductase [Candidatus Bathyarchaeia archaeon]|nr:pyruvate ferredoxin oxidoreductase [Candidatus Bathyarchaeia archaeon]
MTSVIQTSDLVPMSGSEAVAKAVLQAKVNFIAAYPITPQTIIVERLSDLVAAGGTGAVFLNVESEHSALSACVGASLAGARAFTATSSQGLALMHEVLYLTSGLRCPIVMAVANRALSAPLNIHGDHSDMMGSRDAGWIQYYVESAQEAYDWIFQAYKIAEDERVILPFTVNIDGYVITHSVESMTLVSQELVNKFLSPRKAPFRIETAKPITYGSVALPDYYTEFKRQQHEAMLQVPRVLEEVTHQYGELTGRHYANLLPYALEGAKVVIVSLGSVSGTVRWVTKNLRKQGLPVGCLRIGLFRPFPSEQVASLLQDADLIVVLERALSLGSKCGPLASEVVSAMYNHTKQPRILDLIGGLGGRDIPPEKIEQIFRDGLEEQSRPSLELEFLGVRE